MNPNGGGVARHAGTTALDGSPVSAGEAVNNGALRRLLDKEAAASVWRASVDTVERLIQAGELLVVRLPVGRARNGRGRVGACRRVLIDVRDLDALIVRSKESAP